MIPMIVTVLILAMANLTMFVFITGSEVEADDDENSIKEEQLK